MPHRVYQHPCCPGAGSYSPGSRLCPHCRTPGVPDGWGLSVVEHWCCYQRAFGLMAFGPHRALAGRLLTPHRTRCDRCGGSGYVGWETMRLCRACDGGGGIWTGPEAEIEAGYLEVLRQYPDVARPGALSRFTFLTRVLDEEDA